MRLKISARQSALSRIQALSVGSALAKLGTALSPIEVEFHFRESLGDKNLVDPLWKIPEKGVFTADFFQDLMSGKTDLVVHSWKDLPTDLSPETVIAATLERADSRDMLLLKKNAWGKESLKFFSSSPRRSHNLVGLLPQLMPWAVNEVSFESVRGNVQTRVRKLLENPEVDGLILAKAAMDRLLSTADLREQIAPSVQEDFAQSWPEFQEVAQFLRSALKDLRWMVLPLSQNPTAAAQGALAIEVRKDRADLLALLDSLNSKSTFQAAQQERDLLKEFGGGCHLALGMSVQNFEKFKAISVRGKTPAGALVEKYEIQSQTTQSACPQFSKQELWSWPEANVKRQSLPGAPTEILKLGPLHEQGFVVSRSESLPKDFSLSQRQSMHLWAAGFETWKKLAAQGFWVEGCYDGLGDRKDPETQNLLGDLPWTRLTHDAHPRLQLGRHLVTYSVELGEPQEIQDEKFFFWRSGSQFLKALKRYPHIEGLWHAVGPGATLQTLQDCLSQEVMQTRVYLFRSEEDWRIQCLKPS